MNLIDQGMTNEEVASTTDFSLEKVIDKLNLMFKKASVNNKTELVKWWRNQTLSTSISVEK